MVEGETPTPEVVAGVVVPPVVVRVVVEGVKVEVPGVVPGVAGVVPVVVLITPVLPVGVVVLVAAPPAP